MGTLDLVADAPTDWGERDDRWAGVRSDTVVVSGHPVSVLRADPPTSGDLGDGDGLPILLVHGLAGAATNWLEVMGPLAARAGRPVVAVDLPGFGNTEPPGPRAARIRVQERFLPHLLDALGWEQAEVHGNSMGGLLTAMLAGTTPERVGRLVLVSPALPPPWPPDREALRALDRGVLARFAPFLLSWRLGRAAVRRLYATATPEDVFAGTEGLVLGTNQPMREAMRAIGIEQATASQQRPWRVDSLARATNTLLGTYVTDRNRVRDTVAAITAPILVLWGTEDRLVGTRVIDDLLAARTDATRIDLPDVGHVAMIEVPDTYCELVADWREGLDGQAD
ncbi:alpha/beta fold hydrolase [Salsipaludibacter albus]|uniref:alpha/beta fold hydrolase n=1 Tax=Salsipaludibacter albus TaxID=2849650 RepID=UPI001EE4297E|nr:alpha/beta hydrolase [Salsipaludibacter albus]MBY5163376.1 alpha/beta hydrolase [Salsipaludibacter albus]